MAITSAPQLKKEWLQSNRDGEVKKTAKKKSLSRVTNLFRDDHIKTMHVYKSLANDPMPIVKAQVLASMNKTHYKVYV